MIFYILIGIIYWGVFAAFMQTNKDNPKYWDIYQYTENSWRMEMIMSFILGGFFWPVFVAFIIIYKIAFKILNKNKNK
jgi:hypothetical protein